MNRLRKIIWRRSEQLHKPFSAYIADLIAEDARRYQDELAAEGYRLLSSDTARFAEAAGPLAGETWLTWEDATSGSDGKTEAR